MYLQYLFELKSGADGVEFFSGRRDDTHLAGIVKAHKTEQTFGICIAAVTVDDRNMDTFLRDGIETLALNEVFDPDQIIILTAHDAAP